MQKVRHVFLPDITVSPSNQAIFIASAGRTAEVFYTVSRLDEVVGLSVAVNITITSDSGTAIGKF